MPGGTASTNEMATGGEGEAQQLHADGPQDNRLRSLAFPRFGSTAIRIDDRELNIYALDGVPGIP